MVTNLFRTNILNNLVAPKKIYFDQIIGKVKRKEPGK